MVDMQSVVSILQVAGCLVPNLEYDLGYWIRYLPDVKFYDSMGYGETIKCILILVLL